MESCLQEKMRILPTFFLSPNSHDAPVLLAGSGGFNPDDLKHQSWGQGQTNRKRPWIWWGLPLSQLKNTDLCKVSRSNFLVFFARPTAGDGFDPAETQNHQSTRFFGVREGVSHRQGPVQPVKVRHPFIQPFELCCRLRYLRWYFFPNCLYKQACCFFQYANSGCGITTVCSGSGARDWRQTVHW